ncbi:MAG: hypothetical protein ACRD2L_11415, partial [Terriglobia bacterium]
MRRIFFVAIVIFMVGVRSFGQITDWRACLGEPPNPDQTIQNAHREKLFRFLEMLLAADSKAAEKDINDILKVLDDREEARGQASAVLATVAMLRPDGSWFSSPGDSCEAWRNPCGEWGEAGSFN